jgi:signal transduction histidine kinase
MAVSMVEGPDTSSYDLWRLAFDIQSEVVRILSSEPNHNESFGVMLRSHRLYSTIVDINDPPVSVAIRAEDNRTNEAERTDEIFSQWILCLEEQADQLAKALRCDHVVLTAIRKAIYDYLNARTHSDISSSSNTRSFERSVYNFAYGLSHEINNPLANIAARASLLCKEIDTPSHVKSLNTISESALRAHEMLAEMMLAVQEPSISCKSGDLRNFLVGCCREWSARTEQCHIRWHTNIGDDFLWSRFDRVSLSEAIGAAVRNALDACRPGDSIELIADRIESDEGRLEIRVALVDNGPGLSEKTIEQAWDLYFCHREAGRGLGIGLAKIRRIIEAHGGRVWLESKEQAGCAVEIRLPWHYRNRNP